jgi:hypothetical protein
MKKLPTLKNETRALIDAAYPSWGEGLRQNTQANTDSNAYPPLVDFMNDMAYSYRWESGDVDIQMRGEEFKPSNSLAEMEQFIGMLCSTAQACGDTAFFNQLSFITDQAGSSCRKNTDILTAYRFARRMAGRKQPGALPSAAEVAIVFDSIHGRPAGSTDTATIVDLCDRQAVKLELAKGRRGPSKKTPLEN